jgi:hypothetical protein
VLLPTDMALGSDWASEIQKKLSEVDLVIGVVTSDPESRSVFFELGLATAFARQILLIRTPEAAPITFAAHRSLVLRIDLDNRDAMDFALDQILSAPDRSPSRSLAIQEQSAGLGDKSDDLSLLWAARLPQVTDLRWNRSWRMLCDPPERMLS